MNGVDGLPTISDEIPETNPMIFVCVSFPVTDGLMAEMNPVLRSRFEIAGKKPKEKWYEKYILGLKTAGIACGCVWTLKWILRGPNEQEKDDEEFDEAKFFEEYQDFYDYEYDQDEPMNEADLYDEIF